MMRSFPALGHLAAMLPAAQANECEDAADQAMMSACAQQTYAASGAELNRLYREIELRLSDNAVAKKLLLDAEQAWKSYRDAECAFSSSAIASGSAYSMVQTLCLADLTQKRVEDLQQYLACPEEDLGCAVPARSTASADAACASVDTDLTDAREHEYRALIVDSLSADQEDSERLGLGDVEVYSFLASGGWSAVYGAVPTADNAVFFFEDVDGAQQFRDVWAGWADPSERNTLIEWARNLGAPESLATCSAHYVVDAPEADQPYAFTIDLTFTDQALTTLNSREEEVVVSASYYADPAPGSEELADDVGRINLGREELQVAAEPEIVEIAGNQLDLDALQWIEGDILVEISVYSARLSSPDNLISCDTIQGRLSDVSETPPINLQCGMIEEDLGIEVRP